MTDMSITVVQDRSSSLAPYPNEKDIANAVDTLKPPGILSNNYNKQGLKKVERTFIPAKNASGLIGTKDPMYQTNYQSPVDSNICGTETTSYFKINNNVGNLVIDHTYNVKCHNRVPIGTYDRINHVTEGYNQKLHRDDRAHAKQQGLNLNQEECQRVVPATSNALYGAPHRLKLEQHSKQFGHAEICRQDFNRKSGVNMKEE